MKYILVILASVFLLGCQTCPITPVPLKLKDLPPELSVSCPDLKMSPNTDKLSDLITTVTDNYTEYHKCRTEVDGLKDWYNKQQQIINKL